MQNPYSHGVGILAGKGSKPTPKESFVMEEALLFIYYCIPYPVNSVWPTRYSVNIHGMIE